MGADAVMRVVVLSQFYPPEVAAPPVRVSAFATALAARGHDVTVVTPAPNHPQGRFHPGYGRRLVDRRTEAGVQVVRVRVLLLQRGGATARLAAWLSYVALATAVLVGLVARRRADVVLASSPPITVFVPALIVCEVARVPWVADVRDLWPAAPLELGELRPGRVSRLIAALERLVYRRARVVTVAADAYVEPVRAVGGDATRVEVVSNGADLECFRPDPSGAAAWRAEQGIDDGGVVIGYLGNHGLVHDLDLFVAAAAETVDEPLWWCLVGDGPTKDALVARTTHLPRVRWFPAVAPERAAAVVSAFDVLAVPLRPLDLHHRMVTVKLYDAMACAVPLVVATVEGAGAEMVRRSSGGVVTPAGALGPFVAEVRRAAADPEWRRRTGQAGRAWVEQHRDRRQAALALVDLLEGVAR